MGVLFTGKGDKGTSHLGGGCSISKTDRRAVALGNLDELNSLLGAVKSETEGKLQDTLHAIQENLFIIQAIVASIMGDESREPPELDEKNVQEAEGIINDIEEEIEPARSFVIPGAEKTAARLDYARAIARRAERSVVALADDNDVPDSVLAYLNRLSSLLFALARKTTHDAGIEEEHPKYR